MPSLSLLYKSAQLFQQVSWNQMRYMTLMRKVTGSCSEKLVFMNHSSKSLKRLSKFSFFVDDTIHFVDDTQYCTLQETFFKNFDQNLPGHF